MTTIELAAKTFIRSIYPNATVVKGIRNFTFEIGNKVLRLNFVSLRNSKDALSHIQLMKDLEKKNLGVKLIGHANVDKKFKIHDLILSRDSRDKTKSIGYSLSRKDNNVLALITEFRPKRKFKLTNEIFRKMVDIIAIIMLDMGEFIPNILPQDFYIDRNSKLKFDAGFSKVINVPEHEIDDLFVIILTIFHRRMAQSMRVGVASNLDIVSDILKKRKIHVTKFDMTDRYPVLRHKYGLSEHFSYSGIKGESKKSGRGFFKKIIKPTLNPFITGSKKRKRTSSPSYEPITLETTSRQKKITTTITQKEAAALRKAFGNSSKESSKTRSPKETLPSKRKFIIRHKKPKSRKKGRKFVKL